MSDSSSLARVDVFLRSRKRVTLEESPKYPDFSAVLTELGGALSLHLGMSIFTLVGLLEFAWDRAVRRRIRTS